jgi:hypothetical protein
MKYLMLCGFLTVLAGCANEVVFRGEPPAGYTRQEYACKLTGDCFRTKDLASWNTPETPAGNGRF